MVDTMCEPNGGSKETEKIIDGLLRQQPQLLQTVANGNSGAVPHFKDIVDLTSFFQAGLQNLISNPTMAPITQFTFSALQDRPLIIKEEVPSPSSSSSPSSTATAISLTALPSEAEYRPRNVRQKVYADGYIMSFDKKSCCGKKHFWRCERKNECNARMHSNIQTNEIIRKLHPHNHPKPSAEELAFYEQDFSQLDLKFCWPVKHVNRAYMQRKLSRASKSLTPAPLDSKAALQAVISAAMSPRNGKRIHIARGSAIRLSRSPKPEFIKKEVEEPTSSTSSEKEKDDVLRTIELTKKIMELVKPKAELSVNWNGDDGSVLCFLSNDSGAEENVFFPVVLRKRDEKSLITALEGFTGKRCEGRIAMMFSNKVSVLVHESIISNWTHGKLFLVSTDEPTLWRLTPVDAFGEVLNCV